MASVMEILEYVFPVLMMIIGLVLLCFYLHTKKTRASYDVTVPSTQDGNTSSVLHSCLSDNQAEEDRHYDRYTLLYDTLDRPPPYSVIDPRLTNALPEEPPPAYYMYPIMLPLGSHHWMTPMGPEDPTPPL